MFEMEYDRDGQPIPQKQPLVQEVKDEQPSEGLKALEEIPETPVESSQAEEVAEPAAPVVEKRSPTPQESFAELRARAEKIARERDEALYAIQQLQEQIYKQQTQKNVPVEQADEPLEYRPDDLIEGKHLSKFEKKIQKLEEKLKQYEQLSQESTVEFKLKAKYPDFESVVSRQNIETLRNLYPELAQTLNSSSDLYNKAASAYMLIKKLGIYTEDTFSQDREIAQKNAAKPKPSASIGARSSNSPLSNAHAFEQGLTDDLRKQLLKEMQQARKAY